jgi:hypothetical protein
MLTTHLHPVPRSRKHGSIHPLPHTSSCRRAELLKHRDNFTFTLPTWVTVLIAGCCVGRDHTLNYFLAKICYLIIGVRFLCNEAVRFLFWKIRTETRREIGSVGPCTNCLVLQMRTFLKGHSSHYKLSRSKAVDYPGALLQFSLHLLSAQNHSHNRVSPEQTEHISKCRTR